MKHSQSTSTLTSPQRTEPHKTGHSSITSAKPPDIPKPRIGISQCLLGEEVRYDGGHKRDVFITEVLAPFVEWISVCPEVEAGLGIPREAMRLVGNPDAPKLLTSHSKIDLTATLTTFSQKRALELRANDLDGYIFKKNSPSCGIHRIKIFTENGHPSHQGVGIFSGTIQESMPLLPLEEEGRLHDTLLRENFVERIFCYRRWKTQIQHTRLSRGSIVNFHTRHKYLLLTHSRAHYHELGQLVAKAGLFTPTELARAYGVRFMEGLKVKATVKKHVNVLQHLAGHLKKRITAAERAELQETITDYHCQRIPLAVPLMLIKHYVRLLDIPYLVDQVYLNPHPKELILRNHV